MKEPRRLLSHGATDFERQLLRAVVSERPSALLRSRMQRGLGLVGPLAWASNVKAMFGNVVSKVGGRVAIGGIIAIGGIAAVSLIPASNSEPSRAPEAEAVEVVAAEPASAPPEPAPELAAPARAVLSRPAEAAAPEPVVAPAPLPEAPPTAQSALGSPPAEAIEDDSRLREEIALVDAARAAVQQGDRARARETLRVYRERFPNGILRREAKVLERRAEPKRAKR